MCSSRSRSRYSVSAAYLLKPGKAATQVVDCTLLTLKQAVPSLGMCRGGDLIAPLLPQSTKDLVYCWFIAADRSSRATTATCCLLVLLSFLHTYYLFAAWVFLPRRNKRQAKRLLYPFPCN
jgi:hypothetical protein